MYLDEHDKLMLLGGNREDAPQRLYIVLEEAPVVTDLKREVDCLLGTVAVLKEDLRRANVSRSYEQAVNIELMDVVRANGIEYRPGLDISKWHDDLKN